MKAQEYSAEKRANTFGIHRQKRICMHVLRAALHDVRAMRAAQALAAAGFDVTIVDIDDTRANAVEEVQGIHMHHILAFRSFGSTRFEHRAALKALGVFLRCIVAVFMQRADVYHASEITALPVCYLVARLRRKPLVFEAYELPLQDRPLSEMSKGRKLIHGLMTHFITHVLPHCAAIIAVSPPIVEEVKQRYRVRSVQLIRNLPLYQSITRTDCLHQFLGLPSHMRIALYQGYLQPDRGLDRLVRAAAFLDPDVVVIMMGQGVGNTRAELEALVASEGVESRVKIISAVPYEELLLWTASATIGLTIIPLDYTINMQMALPNKLFEYLMAGLPVLSSPIEAITDVLTTFDVGIVVPSMDPEAVGKAINELVHADTTLERLHKNTLQAAQALCWEKESPQLVHLYQNIVDV